VRTALYRRGDLAGAKTPSEQALAIARELGDAPQGTPHPKRYRCVRAWPGTAINWPCPSSPSRFLRFGSTISGRCRRLP